MWRCGVWWRWTLRHDVIIVTAQLTISHLRLLNTDTGTRTEDRLVKLTPTPYKYYTSSGEGAGYFKDLHINVIKNSLQLKASFLLELTFKLVANHHPFIISDFCWKLLLKAAVIMRGNINSDRNIRRCTVYFYSLSLCSGFNCSSKERNVYGQNTKYPPPPPNVYIFSVRVFNGAGGVSK